MKTKIKCPICSQDTTMFKPQPHDKTRIDSCLVPIGKMKINNTYLDITLEHYSRLSDWYSGKLVQERLYFPEFLIEKNYFNSKTLVFKYIECVGFGLGFRTIQIFQLNMIWDIHNLTPEQITKKINLYKILE